MEENNKEHNKENKKKYVLFSPVGKNDPRGHKDSEGSMLHIIRHYKPDKVYLYITKELDYRHKDNGDNRYEIAIKKFHPNCEVRNIFSELEEDDVNKHDAFMKDFNKYIKEIYEDNKDYEILLNTSSGTPQMKTNLLLEVITSDIKLIPIQVDTPNKKANFEDKFSFEDLGKIDEIEENKNKRCYEAKILIFKRVKIKSQIESLIDNYEYSAAYKLFSDNSDNQYISELFGDNLLKYLRHASLRITLKFKEANDIIEFCNDKNLKKQQN